MGRLELLAKIAEAVAHTPTYTLLGIDARGRVVYQTMEGGANSIWVYDEARGQRKRLTGRLVHWAGEVSRKRNRVPFTVDVGRGREAQVIGYVDLLADREVVLESMEPVRVLGFADDGEAIAFAGATRGEVALYLAKGESVEKLAKVDAYCYVSDFQGGLVVGSGNLRKNPRSSEVLVFDVRSGEMRVHTPKEGSINEGPVIAGEKVVFETNAYTGDYKQLAALDPATGQVSRLDIGGDYAEYAPLEHPYYREFEGKLLVVGKRDGRSRIFVDGRWIKTPPGMVHNAFLAGGKVYFTYGSLARPTGIYVSEGGEVREVLVAKLPDEVAGAFGEVEFARVRAPDGVEVPTFVVKSKRAAERDAFVVYVHGGPWWETADDWNPRVAPLVAAGFNVVAPNFRGSTGYGERFRLMDIGDPGGGDLLDVEAAAKWALERGLGRRALIWGYSYGGYMTLWAMFRRPDLFECGVAGAPVADWEEMYELSDAVFREFINILFDNKRELWRERSPSTYAENLKKPLCIIEPANDSRTPLRPVLNLARKLMEAGKAFELHVLPEAGHAITTPDKLSQLLLYMLMFFDKCAGP